MNGFSAEPVIDGPQPHEAGERLIGGRIGLVVSGKSTVACGARDMMLEEMERKGKKPLNWGVFKHAETAMGPSEAPPPPEDE